MEKPKIMILTCMFNRPTVSHAFCEQILRLKKYHANWLDIDVAIGVSDDASAQVCAEYGFQFNWFNNFPLGQKWNTALDFATYNNKFDYLCIMGDDDFMHNKLFLEYMPFIKNKVAHFGVQSLYVYSSEKNQAAYFKYENQTRLMGCGRMVSRTLIDQVGEAGLWTNYLNRGLDNSLEVKLSPLANQVPVITSGVFITDVKTQQNIWPFEKLANMGLEIPVEKALANIGPKELEILCKK